ncbi:MAG TPA: glycosyltransferase [Acidimicrobiales bacterium]|jgi:glycosyltransferase involved in cell wall biosynthesis|nr:glycosyltransferase [Acidimicrobiales bacterium]
MAGHEPLVSVVIPARNEVQHLARCLEAVAGQDWPLSRLEVIVVDGESEDGTAELAEQVLATLPFGRTQVVQNPARSTPSNLNMGLAFARGSYICRVDARSLIPPGYVRTCVGVLAAHPDRAVVGGAQVAVPPQPGAVGEGIARALNNRYTMGMSRYRRGASSGPSDTVYLGFFRTEDLRAIGGWNERFGTNQDFELNRRMSTRGSVWFDDSIPVGYIPRATLGDLYRQYRRFGEWKVRYWRETGDKPQPRQLAALAALPVGALAVALGAAAMVARPRFRRSAGVAVWIGAAVSIRPKDRQEKEMAFRSGPVAAIAAMAVSGGWTVGAWTGLVRAARERVL